MKQITLLLLALLLAAGHVQAQTTTLKKQGTATQLTTDGRPYLILGGELGNSSASCPADIERIFPKLQRMGLNTVLVPAYWDLIEPVEGSFDFSLTDKVLQQARENQLKVVFLWFGAWKNSMSCYAPLWFKQDYKKYPRAMTRNGKPLEIASAFSEAVFEADHRAFTRWMEHIAEADRTQGTVLMIQIENEIGMLEDARDYSPAANRAFEADVPEALVSHLKKNKKQLHPQMLKKWESQGCKTRGNWEALFGQDIYTDEIFMAWHYAAYVERLAQTARRIYNVPLFVNAAMNSRGRRPGEYPSAGPLAHLIDVWHAAAPGLDLLAPDLYDSGFKQWVAQYHRHNNPLFIPEIRLTDNDGVRAFYVLAEHDALGISPFSIEDGSDRADNALVQSYRLLREMTPLIAREQGKGTMKGLLFDRQDKERIIREGDLTITARHFFTLPWDARATDGSQWPEGGGLIMRLAEDEYLVAGSGVVVEFAHNSEKQAGPKALGEDGFALAGSGNKDAQDAQDASDKKSKAQNKGKGTRIGLGPVDEVKVEADGSLTYLRRHNGDQTHQGRHVRISVGDWKVLRVKLYEYK